MLLAGFFVIGNVCGQSWEGSFKIVPAGATDMALEATGPAAPEGGVVTLGKSSRAAEQIWVVQPKGNDLYTIRLESLSSLVLSAKDGGTNNGTPLVAAPSSDAPWQLWSIRRNSNGTLSVVPKHAPAMAIDDFGGSKTAGARQDLWTYTPDDGHLQWVLEPLAGAKVPPTADGIQTDARESSNGTPKAVIKEFSFASSAVFPGTTRGCTLLIPAQYDGSKPACVYVKQDGYDPREKPLLETLIASKEIPVMIGIYVQPGALLGPTKEDGRRPNRSFEYDSVGDNYVRFLADELLPYVARTYHLNLSTNGNDRCIAGASSGGIAAFNAAWERPDAFTRVYANSGSFVAFRGGNEFPTLVRKFEAKPIRTYLTTATKDMENCAGDWYLLDQEMDKALRFAGYDYSFHVVDGPHTAGWIENFAPAMRYLWKDWPEAVREGMSSPRVRDVLIAGNPWESMVTGSHDMRSPVCDSKGNVFFIDGSEDKIYRIGSDNKPTLFVADAARADGLTVGADNTLYTVSRRTGNIMGYDPAGHGRIYSSGVPADQAVAMPGGGLYVSSPGAQPSENSKIWFVEGGTKTLVEASIPNAAGFAYRPDQWLLAVADGKSKWVYSTQIKPDKTLMDEERFFHLHVADWDDDAGPASLTYAREGRLLVATRSGVQICADDGAIQIILPMPEHSRVTGVCLGGSEMNALYAFCGDKIWRRTVQLHAVGAFTPKVPVKGTPL